MGAVRDVHHALMVGTTYSGLRNGCGLFCLDSRVLPDARMAGMCYGELGALSVEGCCA